MTSEPDNAKCFYACMCVYVNSCLPNLAAKKKALRRSLAQGREPRLPSSLYDKETLGTGRATETPEGNANKLREVFEIVRRNMEKASQDQARHYNLRRRQWSPAVGDIVWAKEHHLSKAAEGFAAKLAPRYDGPYQVVDFVSPVICKIRHTQSKKERTVHVGELKQQQNEQTAETSDCLTTGTRRQD